MDNNEQFYLHFKFSRFTSHVHLFSVSWLIWNLLGPVNRIWGNDRAPAHSQQFHYIVLGLCKVSTFISHIYYEMVKAIGSFKWNHKKIWKFRGCQPMKYCTPAGPTCHTFCAPCIKYSCQWGKCTAWNEHCRLITTHGASLCNINF